MCSRHTKFFIYFIDVQVNMHAIVNYREFCKSATGLRCHNPAY